MTDKTNTATTANTAATAGSIPTSPGPASRRSRRAAPRVVLALVARLPRDRSTVAALAVAVALTALFVAATPRQFSRTADAGLREQIGQATVVQRSLELAAADTIAPAEGSDPLASVVAAGREADATLPPSIQEIIADRTTAVTTPNYRLQPLPGADDVDFQRFLTLRTFSGIADQAELVAGSWPGAATVSAAVPLPCRDRAGRCPDQDATVKVLPVALTRTTATQLEVAVGDRMALVMDPEDALARSLPPGADEQVSAVEVTGIVELADASQPFWFGDTRLHRPGSYSTDTDRFVFGQALVDARAYPDLVQSVGAAELGYSWRRFTDLERFDARALPRTLADLRRVEAERGGGGELTARPRLRTRLGDLLGAFRAQQVGASSAQTVVGIGVVAVALTVVALVLVLATTRRRRELVLLRGRGATSSGLVVARGIEGLAVALPAAAIGGLVAVTLVPTSAWRLPVGLAVATGVAVALLAAATVWPVARNPSSVRARAEGTSRYPSRTRLAVDGLVIVLAIVAMVMLRSQGLDRGATNPLLAAAPTLVAFAVALVARLAYPLLMVPLAWVAARRPGLTVPLALRRVARQPATTSLPLLVLALSLSVAVLASVLGATVDRGQQIAAGHRVGASFRVDSTGQQPLRNQQPGLAVPGVEAVAAANVDEVSANGRSGMGLLAVDVAAYRAVIQGTPVGDTLGSALDRLAAADVAEGTVPAVVGGGISTDINDEDLLVLAGRTVDITVVARLAEVPGMTDGAVIVPLDRLRTVFAAEFPPNRFYLRGSAAAFRELEAVVASEPGRMSLTSAAGEAADVRAAPLVSGTREAFTLAAIASTLLGAVGVALALALSSRQRLRDAAYLQTLGVSGRQSLRLLTAEFAPAVTVAVAAGTLAGIAIASMVLPSIDMAAFTGTGWQPVLVTDPVTVSRAILATVGATALGLLALGRAVRRLDVTRTLRMGQQ